MIRKRKCLRMTWKPTSGSRYKRKRVKEIFFNLIGDECNGGLVNSETESVSTQDTR